jgi:hypothetical protein
MALPTNEMEMHLLLFTPFPTVLLLAPVFNEMHGHFKCLYSYQQGAPFQKMRERD